MMIQCMETIWNSKLQCLEVNHRTLTVTWHHNKSKASNQVLIGFSLTVKAATLIFISGRGSAISSAKGGNSGFIYNLVNS